MSTLTATPSVAPDFERGVFYCPSSSSPGTVYEAWLATSEAGTVRIACTCPAGRHARHGVPVPCRHARAVCQVLEDHGLVERDGALWRVAGAVTEVGTVIQVGADDFRSVTKLVGTDCGYCHSHADTTVIPQAWSGARKLIVCSRCGEVTEVGCWPDKDVA